MGTTFEIMKHKYTKWWKNLVIHTTKLSAVQRVVDRINKGKDIYERISSRTGVPWQLIGCIHNMESSCRPNTYLHNGDPLFDANGNPIPTVHVPAGVGPFNPQTFEEAAVHALNSERFKGNKDWSIERVLFLLEGYNGYGYSTRGIPSPYLFSFSNIYEKGLYVADHVFDANAVSQQVGCACVLKLIWNVTEEKPVELPPSNPHLWNPEIFFKKMEALLYGPTPEKIADMRDIVWPSAKDKITKLLKS